MQECLAESAGCSCRAHGSMTADALTMLDVWMATGCAALALFGCHRSRTVVSVSTPSVCGFPPPLKQAGLVSSSASTPFCSSDCRALDIRPDRSH